jgi:DNA-binding transcriptional ArsR family regulator
MKHEDAAKRLAELGNTTRLSIFRYLVKIGHKGAPVGQIQKELGVPNSTLSLPEYEALNELIDFLKSECCTGVDATHMDIA